jgi:hypothetical protein
VLTQVEQVHTIGEAIGRPVRFEEITPEAGRQKMLAAGWPGSMADGLLNAYAKMVTDPAPVTTRRGGLAGQAGCAAVRGPPAAAVHPQPEGIPAPAR